MNLSIKASIQKSSFMYHGVKVSFNEVGQNMDPEYFRAAQAYRDFEHFDEASQVRLVRRYFKHIRSLFLEDLQARSKRWGERQLEIIAPKARALLMLGHPEESGLLPAHETPAERLAWNNHVVSERSAGRTPRFSDDSEAFKQSASSRITFGHLNKNN